MSIKGVFLGAPGVGKSSIIKAYTDGYAEMVHRPTISAMFAQRCENFEGKDFQFGIWDTAGDEKYRSIAPIYFRSANLAFVVVDANAEHTDEDAAYWASQVSDKAENDTVIIFVMNKFDLVTDMAAVEARAQALAASYGDMYCFTSAVTGKGIPELFQFAFGKIGDSIRHLDVGQPKAPTRDLRAVAENPSCC